jgi:uncharacterized protein YcfJ
MNKSMLIGTVFGVAAATAAAGFAGYSMLGKGGAGSAAAPQHCYEVAVETPREAKDEKRIAGTVIGARTSAIVELPPRRALPSGPSPAMQRKRSCKRTGP